MEKTGYKVVRRLPEWGVLESAISSGNIVEYQQGSWTRRPEEGGPLCVFDKFKQAREFSLKLPWLSGRLVEIWECSYLPSSDNCVWDWRDHENEIPLWFLPEGTVLADEVLLRRRVWPRENRSDS